MDLDWLWQRIAADPGIFMKFVGTKQQIADMLTKATFTAEQWGTLLQLAQIGAPYPDKNKKSLKTVHVTCDVQYHYIGEDDEAGLQQNELNAIFTQGEKDLNAMHNNMDAIFKQYMAPEIDNEYDNW